MSEFIPVLPQYLLPKQLLTQIAGWVARAKGGWFTTALIRRFVRHYRVDMSEAEQSDCAYYESFNHFFSRALRHGARPLSSAPVVSPVDGSISQLGAIAGDQIFQAKGHNYSSTALVGGDRTLAEHFDNGLFATIYLSPRDYHRIHMPCDGTLRRMIYVPGSLFSVNPTTARGVPGLFARNERVVCVFDAPRGPFVLTLVGATIVGSMATVWHGVVNSIRDNRLREWHYEAGAVSLAKGEEMGRFLLGSTVVMLFGPGHTHFTQFNPEWQPGASVTMGCALGVSV